jgi:phosphopantetheine--protein transferase-like protein
MRRDLSNELIELFARHARDCTSASAGSVATVLFMPSLHDPSFTERCACVLSENERVQADAFMTADLRERFLQQRAFRRYCGALATGSLRPLSQIEFTTTVKGRPYLVEQPRCWFSFSSCRRGFLGAWSSTHCIGVDIEDETESVEANKLAQKYFSPAEAKAVEDAGNSARARTFLRLWTLKEAALKSIGEGLPFGLDAFRFDLTAGLRVIDAPRANGGAERFRAYAIDVTGSSAALALHCPRSAGRPTPPPFST